MVPPLTMRTKEDFELQMGTNHLGHYLLTRMLIPKLKKTAAEAQVRTLHCVQGGYMANVNHPLHKCLIALMTNMLSIHDK